MAGMRPFGLIFRKSGFFCSLAERFTRMIRYSTPSSSNATGILMPLGVLAVQTSIKLRSLYLKAAGLEVPPDFSLRTFSHRRRSVAARTRTAIAQNAVRCGVPGTRAVSIKHSSARTVMFFMEARIIVKQCTRHAYSLTLERTASGRSTDSGARR